MGRSPNQHARSVAEATAYENTPVQGTDADMNIRLPCTALPAGDEELDSWAKALLVRGGGGGGGGVGVGVCARTHARTRARTHTHAHI
jgi:hypothetical protein